VDNFATPEVRFADPTWVLPEVNVTVPEAAEGETWAVRVTDCPYVDEVLLEDSAVALELGLVAVQRARFSEGLPPATLNWPPTYSPSELWVSAATGPETPDPSGAQVDVDGV
jgi:hypothetical protein